MISHSVSPVRFFFVDQMEEALSFAEEGGIAVQPAAFGYVVLGRRRRLVEWALARGLGHLDLQLPTVTGVYHLDLAGPHAQKVEAELGLENRG